ncbi:CPBP family intramembrane glutamic endopeptidase [Lysobacter korlensis]|uniref:CPBP family intramembrane glutamic endopeptidase n=1 Tax=Lysobacter korlensis TaxID=553636 RepID=A0ABV6RUJ5_9GAMM
MSRKVFTFLAISLGWACLVGAGLFVTGTSLDSLEGILVLAALYMPSPFVAAVIAERGIRRDRFRLPRGGARRVLAFLLAPAAGVFAFALLYLGAVFVGGDLLGLPGFGGLATTQAQVAAGAADLLGEKAVAAAGPPPPAFVLLLAGMWGALVAGWTLNGLFAMGEEYGWRGLLWDELKHLGGGRANLAIGTAWGLWHAPVILQGYNYGSPLLGVPAMVAFCIGMSYFLTALRERTGSVLPVAAAHGIFNALAPMLILLAPGTGLVVAGPLGVVGALLLLLVGRLFWIRPQIRSIPAAASTSSATAVPPESMG